MTAETFLISLLNGISYGLLLFMLSSGLTLIFSMMGVLNFAHASFYMLGAYFAYTLTRIEAIGYWPALVLAPLAVGLLGALFERVCLRRVHKFGHVPELLVTFGLSYLILEVVQLVWGRAAVDYRVPEALAGSLFTITHAPPGGLGFLWGGAPPELCGMAADPAQRLSCTQFPAYRAFMMCIALLMLAALWLVLARTRIGLVIRAALTHPEMVEALGHNVPRIFMLVFGGGTALAGLAGVIGGNAFITEPSMALALGPIIFVVVVLGGMGSLAGAFLASILIGLVQTFGIALDHSLLTLAQGMGWDLTPQTFGYPVLRMKISEVAPILPYLLLVLMLIFRPRGLLGTREG